MESPIVALKGASKSFVDGKEIHRVLEEVDFTLATGTSVALTGASGSGKSTLLNVIAGFEPLSVPYWEGPVILKRSHSGSGYMELTGY